MVRVHGVYGFTATADGGVSIEVLIDGRPMPLALSGEEWRQISDLLRMDARVQAILAEAREQTPVADEGIKWTP